MSLCRKIAFVLISLLPASSAWGEGVFVNPLRVEIIAPAGAEHEDRITLRNDEREPLRVGVEVLDETPLTGNPWIESDVESIILQPGKTRELIYRVKVPQGASGELRARILLSRETELQGPVELVSRMAVPIYVTIKGTELRAAEIQDIRACASGVGCFEVVVANRGNVHIRPVGELRVLSVEDGAVHAAASVNEWGYPVLPGEVAVLRSGVMNWAPDARRYILEVILSFDDAHITGRRLRIPVAAPGKAWLMNRHALENRMGWWGVGVMGSWRTGVLE